MTMTNFVQFSVVVGFVEFKIKKRVTGEGAMSEEDSIQSIQKAEDDTSHEG